MKDKKPKQNLPKIPLCTNIRTNAKMGIKPCFLDGFYESHQIKSSFKVILQNYKRQKINKQISSGLRYLFGEKRQSSFEMQKMREERAQTTYIARRRLMDIPKDISLNYIQPTIFGLHYEIFPHLQKLTLFHTE